MNNLFFISDTFSKKICILIFEIFKRDVKKFLTEQSVFLLLCVSQRNRRQQILGDYFLSFASKNLI